MQTRQALLESAYRLFAEQGYDKTSIEDITRDANFAPRTFFLHFASKEDLLFPDVSRLRTSLEAALMARAAQTSTLEVLRHWVLVLAEFKQKRGRNADQTKLQRRIIDADPSLQGREKMYLSSVETLLVREISKDMGVAETAAEPRIVAAAALGALAAVDRYGKPGVSVREIEMHISLVIDFLQAGMRRIAPDCAAPQE